MGKVNASVSKALQETVREHLHIGRVHFDSKGNHYFNVHEHEVKNKEDKDLAGLYGHIHIKNVVDNNGRKLQISTPNVSTKIVESVDREDILKAEPVSDLLMVNNTIGALFPEEQKIIEKMRASNSKGVKVEEKDPK